MRALSTNQNRPLPPAQEDAQALFVLAVIASFIPGLIGALLDTVAAGVAGTTMPATAIRSVLAAIALLTRVIGAGILAVLAIACLSCAVVHVWSSGRARGSDKNWALAAMYAAGAVAACIGLFVAW